MTFYRDTSIIVLKSLLGEKKLAKLVVSRLQNYPVESPQSWVIGFTVTSDNNRSFFIDTSVNYNEATSDKDAVDLAYKKLKPIIDGRLSDLQKEENLIGQTYEPVES